jgi:xanthosine utilization system XapX-like protein
MDLSSVVGWTLKPRLPAIPGVAKVAVLGIILGKYTVFSKQDTEFPQPIDS